MTFPLRSLLTVLILAGLGANAFASWAAPDDADYAVDSETMDFQVHKDGTYKLRHDRVVEILKESARNTMGVGRFYYDPDAEKFKLLKAETVNDGKSESVGSQFIEDKAVASESDGFDNHDQVSVIFPDVKVGSKLRSEYVRNVEKVGVEGFFSQRIFFGLQELLKARTITVRSETPLYLEVNDPLHRLAVDESKDHKTFKIELKDPVFSRVIHEQNSDVDEKDKTWIVFSNARIYKDVFQNLARKFEAVVSSPLPPAFQEIVDQAKKQKSDVARINAVTSKLAEMVRYIGDWRELKGAYEPHNLATIAETKFGDCKDFSVSTAAMLRALGMKTTVLALERGKLPSPWPSLPLLSALNHAMVKVEAGGRTYWIDPTNFQSFAQGVFDDVADRPAVALDPANIRVVHIDGSKPSDAVIDTDMRMNFFRDGDVSLDGSMVMHGRAAVPVTGASLFAPQEELSYQLATSFFPAQNLKDYKIDGLNLTSRIVSDAKFSVHLTAQNTSLKTTAGYALRLPDAGVVNVISDIDLRNRVGDLVLDNPSTLNLIYRLENVKVIGDKLPGCRLTSPWLDASLRLVKRGHTAYIHDVFSTKTERVPADVLKTPEFGTFQAKFKDCFENVAVVYEPLGRSQKVKLRTLSSTN